MGVSEFVLLVGGGSWLLGKSCRVWIRHSFMVGVRRVEDDTSASPAR